MERKGAPIIILMADDDWEDCMLAEDALSASEVVDDLRFVGDGEELMDYLLRRDKYKDPAGSPTPSLILLDLNMPKKDGREALAEIKSKSDLRSIPVVVLTTSKAEEDIDRCYDLGANSFISKPVSFESLGEIMTSLDSYWFRTVQLPGNTVGA